MDYQFNDCPRIGMYRAGVVPDLYPDEKLMLVDRWSKEDQEMFVGGIYARR